MPEAWSAFYIESRDLLLSGGWLMIPLFFLALLIYGTAFRLYFFFSQHPFYRIPKTKLANWILNPVLASGEIRAIIDYSQDGVGTPADVQSRFAEIRNVYVSWADRRRNFLMILIGAAPLTGLLGTVTGMLSTFEGLAVSRGGDTIDRVAGGISEALVTTQTGLIIAIPAYVLGWVILKRRNEMDACLTSMETITVQLMEKRLTSTES